MVVSWEEVAEDEDEEDEDKEDEDEEESDEGMLAPRRGEGARRLLGGRSRRPTTPRCLSPSNRVWVSRRTKRLFMILITASATCADENLGADDFLRMWSDHMNSLRMELGNPSRRKSKIDGFLVAMLDPTYRKKPSGTQRSGLFGSYVMNTMLRMSRKAAHRPFTVDFAFFGRLEAAPAPGLGRFIVRIGAGGEKQGTSGPSAGRGRGDRLKMKL
jgi:hypothetical protein